MKPNEKFGAAIFYTQKAENEPWLIKSGAFVPPHDFEFIGGPHSVVVFGEQGTGKTACCMALEQNSPFNQKQFVVHWHSQIPEYPVETGVDSIILLQDILYACAKTLIYKLSEKPSLLLEAGVYQEFLIGFLKYFLKTNDFTELLSDSLSNKELNQLKSLIDRYAHDAIEESLSMMAFATSFTNCMANIGFSNVWIMIDWAEWASENQQINSANLLRLFFSSLKLFDIPNLSYKIFLPSELEVDLADTAAITNFRVMTFQLSWDSKHLSLILERRIALSFDENISLDAIYNIEEIFLWLEACGGSTPRGWLEYFRPIFSTYWELNSGGKRRKLTTSEWNHALQRSYLQIKFYPESNQLRVGMGAIKTLSLEVSAVFSYLYNNKNRFCTKKELYFKAYLPFVTPESKVNEISEHSVLPKEYDDLINTIIYRVRQVVEPNPKSKTSVFLTTRRDVGVRLTAKAFDDALYNAEERIREVKILKKTELNLDGMKLVELPESISQLTELQILSLSGNKLSTLPTWIGQLSQLRTLDLSHNLLTLLPESLGNLNLLHTLILSFNRFFKIDSFISRLESLKKLHITRNQLIDLPISLAQLEQLEELDLSSNPLNSELAEAYKHGIHGVKAYLRIQAEDGQITITEAKLILVGDGEVGKTCLLDALLDNPWEEHPSTHGIQIKPINLSDPSSQTTITLNTWDFGGQRVYRPTHQLFFSAPAVYLVVWKPREGVEQGFVKEWIQLVKRRAPEAKFLIVATHRNIQQRQPDIDRQELWDLFGRETVVDFFFVDSKPDAHGQRKGIDELKRAIAQVAASLPEVGRSVPKSFADVRQALQDKGAPYLPLREVLDICRAQDMDDEIARLYITISHRLGHLTHYENDPTLRDIVILRPDWLATAMSYVLDDEETRAKHGLVNFSRLSHLWDDSTRAADSRYEKSLHPIFLRLMERFDLSYRVADPTSRSDSDPVSLIGQLVPDIRPQNLSAAWESSPASGDIQQTQICHIVDASNGQSASAEGLFYQLIVRLHKYSLGRVDYKDSVHWQRGLVLEDEYKSRAILEHVGNDVRITVRSPYPEGLLGMLTREVKFLVESFWEGLRCDVMVPCLNEPCIGLFEVGKLMENKKRGRPEVPCIVCNDWQDINRLLSNAPAATPSISIIELQSEFTIIKDKLDEVNVTSRRILSQVDKTYTDLLHVLTDEAKEGPRLFSFFPVDRSAFNPKTWIREKFRLVLWCEHSRLPLPVLNNGDMKKGVYDLELEREWFKKASPYLKFLTGTLGMVLPVASSAVKLALDETAYKLIEEQLDFGKSIIDSAIGETSKIGDFLDAADSTNLEHGVAARADGSTLRELHALLKAKDPGFGGLVRVMNKRQEFLWVHEKFAGEY